ncbi:MAG: hypothetical protein FWD52_04695 [Candidatus Bathyarchaeota archaeon]|nr:hypothetical protein [Candidatus Termiticorpusculum sp.]
MIKNCLTCKYGRYISESVVCTFDKPCVLFNEWSPKTETSKPSLDDTLAQWLQIEKKRQWRSWWQQYKEKHETVTFEMLARNLTTFKENSDLWNNAPHVVDYNLNNAIVDEWIPAEQKAWMEMWEQE